MKKPLGAIFFLTSSLAWGWGERGHHLICLSATRLLQEENLRVFLRARGGGHMLGHLCNLPDIDWRSQGPAAKVGDATHFLDASSLEDLKKTPLLFKDRIQSFPGKSLAQVAKEGTLWWRADQFFRRALEAGRRLQKAPPPEGHAAEQDWQQPYNAAAFDLVVNLGLMGHFVGDGSMPYHSARDYDGHAHGHGGIHSYYETESVDALSLGLEGEVFTAGQKLRQSPGPARPFNLIERMKELALVSYPEITQIEALDPLAKDTTRKAKKRKAPRAPAEEGAQLFKNLLVTEMARAAALLAEAWDEVYRAAGRPPLEHYRAFHYPLTVPFVPPDYL